MHGTARSGNIFLAALLVIALAFSCHAFAKQTRSGGLPPSDALEYMKKTPGLFIVDVSPPEKFNTIHFTGSVNIPQAELVSRINEFPQNRPVLLHCRFGRTCAKAYPLLRKMRPDIPEIFCIDGKPLFAEYNNWKKKQE